jgi:hypothetical protein
MALCILFLLWAVPVVTSAQTAWQNLPVKKMIADSLLDFEVDNLGKLYLIGANGQLKKLDQNFDSVGLFNDIRRFGPLQGIDVSNPLKVLLFYKAFNTIQILDRFLNVRSTLDLRKAGILQVSAITQSYDNNIWIFDELDSKIKKVDEAGKLLLESNDFRVLFNEPLQPYKLEDYNKYLYAYDANIGLLVMDYFGAYRNMIPFIGWKNLHGISKGIVATDEEGLVYYQPGQLELKKQSLPKNLLDSKKIRVHNQLLYVLGNDGRLRIYVLPG